MIRFIQTLLFASLSLWPITAQAFDTPAKAALVLDHNTGTVLLSKNADEARPPASMSKLMTVLLIFEALREGKISMDSTFTVSEKAWKMGGSKMFLRVGETVSIENLLKGITVQSGNDACIAVAEGLAGTEKEFVAMMNKRGAELGLTHSHFANPTGWPDPEHYMSARDLMTLARYIIDEFPEYYSFFSIKEFKWDGITQENRNPLLKANIGADGLKTGHTSEAGYSLVGSVTNGDRRILLVIGGLDSERQRESEAARIVKWALEDFEERALFDAGESIFLADVWMGKQGKVQMVSEKPLNVLVPRNATDPTVLTIQYSGPIEAPISKNQKIGELVMSTEAFGESRFALLAGDDVPRGGFLTRIEASAKILSGLAASEVKTLIAK